MTLFGSCQDILDQSRKLLRRKIFRLEAEFLQFFPDRKCKFQEVILEKHQVMQQFTSDGFVKSRNIALNIALVFQVYATYWVICLKVFFFHHAVSTRITSSHLTPFSTPLWEFPCWTNKRRFRGIDFMGIETDDRVNFSRLVQFHKKERVKVVVVVVVVVVLTFESRENWRRNETLRRLKLVKLWVVMQCDCVELHKCHKFLSIYMTVLVVKVKRKDGLILYSNVYNHFMWVVMLLFVQLNIQEQIKCKSGCRLPRISKTCHPAHNQRLLIGSWSLSSSSFPQKKKLVKDS